MWFQINTFVWKCDDCFHSYLFIQNVVECAVFFLVFFIHRHHHRMRCWLSFDFRVLEGKNEIYVNECHKQSCSRRSKKGALTFKQFCLFVSRHWVNTCGYRCVNMVSYQNLSRAPTASSFYFRNWQTYLQTHWKALLILNFWRSICIYLYWKTYDFWLFAISVECVFTIYKSLPTVPFTHIFSYHMKLFWFISRAPNEFLKKKSIWVIIIRIRISGLKNMKSSISIDLFI